MLKEDYGRMVEAIRQKASVLCPDSLEMIGVYGSCATGDTHEKSDLDLLILIRDEAGRCLADGFILDDCGIGFDFYCTTWKMLEEDAECGHPHLGKLMDAKVLWVRDHRATERMEDLRARAASVLASEARFTKAEAAFGRGKKAFAECCLAESLSHARYHAAGAMYEGLSALMLSRGRYFRRGVKRTLEEASDAAPTWDVGAATATVMEAETVEALREALRIWLRGVRAHMATAMPPERATPCRENLAGTYEEMVSNWRNKMDEAADREDPFSSFMNLASLQGMLDGMAAEVDMPAVDAMAEFDPRDLRRNGQVFDRALAEYLEVYRRAGMEPKRYADVEAFIADYLGGIE